MEIRRVRPEERRELRDARLRALREAPDAIATRHETDRGEIEATMRMAA